MGFAKTVTTHLRNMTSNFGKTCMPWGVKRSVAAGCSGALFALPGLVAFKEDDGATTVMPVSYTHLTLPTTPYV